jgi:hypothetical protein
VTARTLWLGPLIGCAVLALGVLLAFGVARFVGVIEEDEQRQRDLMAEK